jgi:hypothetical protein
MRYPLDNPEWVEKNINMKTIIGILTLAAAATFTQAQDMVPREDALKYAFAACADMKNMRQTAIPTDPDVKRPVVVRDGEYGLMVLPEGKLNAKSLEKPADKVVPIGQLWAHKLAPLKGGSLVDSGLYNVISLRTEEGSIEAPMFALGFRKTSDGKAELLLFGKSKEPIVVAEAKPVDKPQDNWIGLSVERTSDRGIVTLNILGKYEASLDLTDPELFQ